MRGAVVLIAALLAPQPASAQARCLPAEAMRDELAAQYGQAPVGAGLTGTGQLLELWASADGASWTVLVTSVRGVSCVAARGHAYTPIGRPRGEPT